MVMSWFTLDTGRTITSVYSERPTFAVYMHTPDGRVWREDNYGGYGEFGGKDYYVLLAELNGIVSADPERMRSIGVTIGVGNTALVYPILTESPVYEGAFDVQCPACPDGGEGDDSEDLDELVEAYKRQAAQVTQAMDAFSSTRNFSVALNAANSWNHIEPAMVANEIAQATEVPLPEVLQACACVKALWEMAQLHYDIQKTKRRRK